MEHALAVKARYKTVAGVMLGLPGMGVATAPAPADDLPPPPARRWGDLLGKLKDPADALPR